MVTHRGECFCGAVRSRSRGSLKAWAFAIAGHAGGGWQPRQRLHAVETWRRADHARRRACRHVPEDAGEPAAILQGMRRTFADLPSPARGWSMCMRRRCRHCRSDRASTSITPRRFCRCAMDCRSSRMFRPNSEDRASILPNSRECRRKSSVRALPPRKRAILATLPYRRIVKCRGRQGKTELGKLLRCAASFVGPPVGLVDRPAPTVSSRLDERSPK